MAATFNSPLASILLAVELLLFEWRPRSLVPVSAGVAVATVVRQFILGTAPVFPVIAPVTGIHWPIDVLALVIGICGATVAIAATRLVYLAEDAFARLPIHWMWWPAIGGGVIGLGGLVEPRALGVGYDVIRALLTGQATLSLIVGILVVKTAIWSLSLGSGTSGGVLAPVMVHLTGIVFTLELTHLWPAMFPLTIASITAYAASVLLLDRSILTEKIARRGLHLTRDYTTDPLETFFVADVMRTEPAPTPAGGIVETRDTLRHAANVLAESGGLPLKVVTPDGAEQGHLLLQDLLVLICTTSTRPPTAADTCLPRPEAVPARRSSSKPHPRFLTVSNRLAG